MNRGAGFVSSLGDLCNMLALTTRTSTYHGTLTATPARHFWRVKHDKELPQGIWRAGLPSVHPILPNHHSPFQKWAQLVSFELNPWLDEELWTKFYHYRYAFTNDNGYGDDSDPRANFVTGEDTTAPLPRVEALVTGGSMIEGERLGDWVKVRGLHYNTPVTAEYLRAHPEFWVRGVYASAAGVPYKLLGHKYDGPPCVHPLIVNDAKGELHIEAWKLVEWTGAGVPEPLKLYL